MAEQRRNLNIPQYEASGSTTQAPAGARERLAGAGRRARANGVRDTLFTRPVDAARSGMGLGGERVRARQDGRTEREARAREQEGIARERSAADGEQARERADLRRRARRGDDLAQLRLDSIAAGERYTASLRESGILGAGQTKETQRKTLTGMHQVYASMMVLQCVQPIKKGLSAENVASTLGMGAAMWFLSPDFRTQLGSFAGQMKDVLKGKIEGRGEKKDAKAQRKFDKLEGKGRADQLRGKWQRRLDKIEFAERGHRLPFTAHSAALTELSLTESAYRAMRMPGADQAQVQDRYSSAMSALYEYIEADNVDPEAVARMSRTMVGQRMAAEPGLANVFSELGHGRFTKSAPREVYVEGSTEPVTVWTGDFVDSYEGRTVSSGSFHLRPPMNVDEHRVMAGQTLAAEMVGATSVGELNDVLSHYMVASCVDQYPKVLDQVENDQARSRLSKAGTMFSSMRADGLSDQERHLAYSAAYIDAVEAVQQINPEIGALWAEQYGQDWRENVAEAMAHYNDLGAQAQGSAPTQQTSPAPEPEPEQEGAHFTADAQGTVWSQEEDIVDAEVIDDDEPSQDEASDAVDADVQESAPRYTASQLREMVWVDDGRGDPASRAVEGLSDAIADDIEASMSQGDPDGSTWKTRHVYRSRTNALGRFDPQRMIAAGHLTDVADYPREVGLGRMPEHTPWADDREANALGVRTVMAAKQMSRSGITPTAQDHLHSAAYVRGLEKVVGRNPAYEAVVQRMVAREGGNAENWREHEFAGALGRTQTGRAHRSYAEETSRLDLAPAGSESALDQARDSIRDGLSSTSEKAAYDQKVSLRSTSAKVRRARVNQHYNEVDTGRFTGLGSDDAAPLQDAGYELG